MPELPEVETVKNGLKPVILGQKITGAILRRENLRLPMPPDLDEIVRNRVVADVTRRAKYLIISLDNGRGILIHLGMSGKLIWHQNAPASYGKHDHAIINFQHGCLVLTDPRRFGLLLAMNSHEHPLPENLGIEPLNGGFNGEYIANHIKNRKQNVKVTIMDGQFVVGVGNIYASESLFRAGIHPCRPANSLGRTECSLLADNIKQVLAEAIESGGSTLRDYVRSDGGSGYFQHAFRVYGREGQACVNCGNGIKRVVLGQRASFHCDICQK